MAHSKQKIKQKTSHYGVGNNEDNEVEVSESSRSSSGGVTKGSKEMTHVSASITMGCVDLTQDQFLDMVERAPSL